MRTVRRAVRPGLQSANSGCRSVEWPWPKHPSVNKPIRKRTHLATPPHSGLRHREAATAQCARQEDHGRPVGPGRRRHDDRRQKRDPHLDIPARIAVERQIQQEQAVSSRWAATRTAASCSTCRRPRATCRPCSWPAAASSWSTSSKTTSLRGLYYLLKHTIDGTKEETFDDQDECDPIIEDLEVTLNALREELHLYAKKRGRYGRRRSRSSISGDEIDCSRMGSGGYGIPSIVEPEVIQFKKCDAKFILHVEKDTVWQRFNEDKFWRKHNCMLTHGGGQPPRGVRRMLTGCTTN